MKLLVQWFLILWLQPVWLVVASPVPPRATLAVTSILMPNGTLASGEDRTAATYPTASLLSTEWIHFRPRSEAVCIHRESRPECRDGFRKTSPDVTGYNTGTSKPTDTYAKKIVNGTLASEKWIQERRLDDHTKTLTYEPLVSGDNAVNGTAGYEEQGVKHTETVYGVRYHLEEQGTDRFCEAGTAIMYQLDFGPRADWQDCGMLREYLKEQDGYFLATKLDQMTPLAVWGTCYIQIVRKEKSGVNTPIGFGTADVVDMLDRFLATSNATESTLANVIGETVCGDSELGWMVSGYYQKAT